MSAVPKLRFPEFEGEWEVFSIGDLGQVITGSTPSTKNNDFYGGDIPFFSPADIPETPAAISKSEKTLTSLGFAKTRRVRKGATLFVCIGSTIGKLAFSKTEGTTNQQINSVVPSDNHEDYFVFSALQRVRERVRDLSATHAVPIINKSSFSSVTVLIPSLPEQQKIASFLSSIDKKIDLLRQKKDALALYKKGLMQKIFSQEIRFKQDDGSDFPDWEDMALGDVLHEHKEKSAGQEPVFSVSVSKGLVNQIEHLGRSFSAADTGHYNKAKPHDVIYTKSPTGNFPLGIIKQSTVDFDVIVSPLYGVFTPETAALGFILNVYFESEINVGNYLSPLVQKGAKNTIACTNKRFLEGKLKLPRSHTEQRKIAGLLAAIQKKIAVTSSQIEQMETFKKGLLQQMFV